MEGKAHGGNSVPMVHRASASSAVMALQSDEKVSAKLKFQLHRAGPKCLISAPRDGISRNLT